MHHKPAVPPSKTRHDILCAPGPEFRFFTFDMKTRLFWIGLWQTAPPRCIWSLSAACTKDRSVGDKQLLLPLTLNQGDVMRVKKTVWSSWTWQAAQVASQPHPAASPLITLSPLFSFPSSPFGGSAHLWESHHFTVWCSGTPRRLSAQEGKGNVSCQGRTVCFYASLIPTQYCQYSSWTMCEIAVPCIKEAFFKHQKEWARYGVSV